MADKFGHVIAVADPTVTEPRPRLERLGPENVPLLIVDHAYPVPEDLTAVACEGATFARPVSDYYPGVRAVVPDEYAQWLTGAATRWARQVDLLTNDQTLKASACTFAVATNAPNGLAPIQRIPHFDTCDASVYAVVHYLCAPPFGGTSFYRHRRSGYQRIDAARSHLFRSGLNADARAFGFPPADYISGDTDSFERVGTAALRFNRAVLYPANCLHAAELSCAPLIDDPPSGRLTITSLLDVRGSAAEALIPSRTS